MTKLNIVSFTTIVLTILSSGWITVKSTNAQERFYCDENNLFTSVNTQRGSIPLIRWVDRSFPPPYSPIQRCQIVSARFRKFDNNGTLKYIKADEINNLPVLCVTAYKGGSCLPNGLLVTFKPETDANQTLARLLNRRVRAAEEEIQLCANCKPHIVSMFDGEIYFDIENFLKWGIILDF